MDLFIRAGYGDTRVIEKLCAPATAGFQVGPRVPMRGLIADATVASARQSLRRTADAAGVPYLVDPMTYLLQGKQEEAKGFATLPFGMPDQLLPGDLASGEVVDELIDRVITFQRDQGATILIPPYVYADEAEGPWFEVAVQMIRRTARYLEREGISLPVAPIFAASLRQFGPRAAWDRGIDPFIDACTDMNTRFVGVAMSWARPTYDTTDVLGTLLTTIAHASSGTDVVAWRQGQYGAAAVACGAVGYETGPGVGERCDFPSQTRSRRPKPPGSRPPRVQTSIYLPTFGRSFQRKPAEAMLTHPTLKATLICSDDSCCPDGATSMATDWREHAIRARGRPLDELRQMPNTTWRLNKVARDAERAVADARLANDVLKEAQLPNRVPERSFRALSEVADAIRNDMDGRAVG